jgi:chemotaxis protein CheD
VVETSSVADSLPEVRIDMAEMKVEKKPSELVSCVGSCIAICLYDSSSRSGGLAHIMLPQAGVFPNEDLPSKFADTAVPALIKEMKKLNPNCILTAKIAGGANMFPNIRNQTISIGTKNSEAVKSALALHKIPIRGEDVGGTQGRKITFNTQSGIVSVRLLSGEVKKL